MNKCTKLLLNTQLVVPRKSWKFLYQSVCEQKAMPYANPMVYSTCFRFVSSQTTGEEDKKISQRLQLQRIWTIPNILSTSRIAMAPLLGYLVGSGQTKAAICLLAACGASDLVDGWVARRFGQQSALGSILDPLGDKLLVGTLTVSLWWTGQLPWWLLVLIVGRDAALLALAIVTRCKSLTSSGSAISWSRFFDPSILTPVITPTMISKVNTALQLLLLGLTLCDPLMDWPLLHNLLPSLEYIVGGTTAASAIVYFLNYKKSVRFLRTQQRIKQ